MPTRSKPRESARRWPGTVLEGHCRRNYAASAREGKTDAMVLVGHSQGANNVIDMARVLEAQNVPVALLVTLAPYRQDPCRLMSCGRSTITNLPVGELRLQGDLVSGASCPMSMWRRTQAVSHINIDKSARIQAEIAREIGALVKAK